MTRCYILSFNMCTIQLLKCIIIEHHNGINLFIRTACSSYMYMSPYHWVWYLICWKTRRILNQCDSLINSGSYCNNYIHKSSSYHECWWSSKILRLVRDQNFGYAAVMPLSLLARTAPFYILNPELFMIIFPSHLTLHNLCSCINI
jgi:hypothetical protein